MLLLLSMKPARHATKTILTGQVLEKLEFKVCENRLEACQTWQAHPGSIVIQFRQAHIGWPDGIPEILPQEKGGELGFVNIAGRFVCRPVRPAFWDRYS